MAPPGEVSTPSARAASATPGSSGDWAAQAADTVEAVVSTIRSKTTVPLRTIARAVVYGIVAAVLGVTALVLLVAALVRGLDVLLPRDVWAAHLVLGGMFTLAGLFAWSKRG